MRSVFVLLPLAACAPLESQASTFTDGGEDRLATPGTYTWRFDDGMPPELFDVLGDWEIQRDELVQTGRFAGPDYPRMIVQDLSVTDFHLSVKCKSEMGSIDRACGLLFRAVDSDNYLITRANNLEDNIRFYRVVNGDRMTIKSADKSIDNGYHELEVDARGTHVEISWDGDVVISAEDETFSRGAIGVWTKADSIVRFDDLVLEIP